MPKQMLCNQKFLLELSSFKVVMMMMIMKMMMTFRLTSHNLQAQSTGSDQEAITKQPTLIKNSNNNNRSYD